MFNPIKYVNYLIKYSETGRNHFYTVAENYRKGSLPNKLVKYYSLTNNKRLNTKKLKCLKNNLVFLPDVSKLNDPFEFKSLVFPKDKMKKFHVSKKSLDSFLEAIDEVTKCASFSKVNHQCMPMWANYSNNHCGYCVEYVIDNEIKKRLI